MFSLFQNWIGNYKRSFKACSKPGPPKQKLYTRELSPYNLFCRDILKNKGDEQYLIDAFNCYTKWTVVVHSGPVYIRGSQGSLNRFSRKYLPSISQTQCKTAVSIEKNHQVIYCKRYIVFAALLQGFTSQVNQCVGQIDRFSLYEFTI